MIKFGHLRTAAAFITLGFLLGCVANPVTGKKELRLVSQAHEIQLGAKNYFGYQQMQGGDLVSYPELSSYVKKVGQNLVQHSDRAELPYDFVVLNNGVPNAWALPGGKIAINRGLLVELNNEAELAAVLGHEIVHAAARHGAKNMERGLLLQGALIGAGIALEDHDHRDIILTAGGLGGQLVNLKYGRSAELESDLYGIKYMARAGYDPSAAVSLQETFVRLSEGKQAGLFGTLFSSHPPSQDRVDANRVTARLYPDAVFTGEEAFKTAMQPLLKAKEAYVKLDEGMKALKDKNAAGALRLAMEGLKIEPREAHLHALKANALDLRKDTNGALKALDQAIQLNGKYYEYHLRQAQLYKKLGRLQSAKASFQKSNRLLPTASAHHALGEMALREGRKDQALGHFQVAAVSGNQAGLAARTQLARLELPRNPEKYLKAVVRLKQNRFDATLEVHNRSPVSVDGVRVRVMLVNRKGRVKAQETVRMPFRIGPGASARRNVSFRSFTVKEGERIKVQSRITQARVID